MASLMRKFRLNWKVRYGLESEFKNICDSIFALYRQWTKDWTSSRKIHDVADFVAALKHAFQRSNNPYGPTHWLS